MTHEGRTPHLAIYGNIRVTRGYCSNCETYAFVSDGKLRCCERQYGEEPKSQKRMSQAPWLRQRPSAKMQQSILNEQDYRCLYCFRRFGSVVYRNGKTVKLRIHWDHQVPWSYGQNNQPSNFAAACHVCNGIKWAHIFKSIEEIRIYVEAKWREKEYIDEEVRPVRIRLSPVSPVAKVLQAELQTQGMDTFDDRETG